MYACGCEIVLQQNRPNVLFMVAVFCTRRNKTVIFLLFFVVVVVTHNNEENEMMNKLVASFSIIKLFYLLEKKYLYECA